MSKLSQFLTATEDGSLSLLEPELDELYHNRAGAFTEALVNYAAPALAILDSTTSSSSISSGSSFRSKALKIRVLDSCFGLGYNSLVFASELEKLNQSVYRGRNTPLSANRFAEIEAVELSSDVLDLLPEICAQPCFSNLPALKGEMLEVGGSTVKIIRNDLRLYLQKNPVQDLDFIFHDAFSPRKVPELWTIDIFQRFERMLKPGGAILTYSSAPAVRGALQDLGFTVLRTTGLGGKSGGTAAIKGHLEQTENSGGILSSQFPAEEIRRLNSSSRVPYRDKNLAMERENIIAVRLQEQKEFS